MLRNLSLSLLILAVLAITGAAGASASSGGCTHVSSGTNGAFGAFSAANQPGPCWRPYSPLSPFNQTIGPEVKARADSREIVSQLTHGVPISHFYSGDPNHDAGVPVYWSHPGDPVYTLHCVEDWGHCDIEGLQIPVPTAARPSGSRVADPPDSDHDAQMTIVDQRTGWEYDLWNVRHKGPDGGNLTFGWGGRVRINGRGLKGYANAAGYGLLGGLIRLNEFRSGVIDHALLLTVPCSGRHVYPALQGSTTCAQAGIANSAPAPLGSRFQLTMSIAEIKRLHLARWKEGILIALHRYGAYVSDTTGDRLSWGIEVESQQSYTSFHLPNPLIRYGRSIGLEPHDFWGDGYRAVHFPVPSRIDWSRMRVLEPLDH